jgi:hypothetical protein
MCRDVLKLGWAGAYKARFVSPLKKGKRMPKMFLAISAFAASLAALSSPVMAQDYSSCLRQGPNAGCYYNSGSAYNYYYADEWVRIRLLRAGIPGNPDAGGGPTGASQATNRPRASNEKY